MNNLVYAIQKLQKEMDKEDVNPTNGLPLDLFEFATTLLPFINVDLLILNSDDQLLLSWRSDVHYGTGWHIPGGIIRMQETIEERIQRTALEEIGSEVSYEKDPILVYENIIQEYRPGLQNQLERSHNISLLYKCRVPCSYRINNTDREESDNGYLKWFDKFPDNLMKCHHPVLKISAFNKWI